MVQITKTLKSHTQGGNASLAVWAITLMLALLWLLALAASPSLHELVHPDAGHEDHDCAVTVFLSGGFGQVVAEPIIIRQPDLEFAYLSPGEIRETIIAGPTTRSILEHGPPRYR